ncbi:MAG: FMN-binding protein [Desulfobacterales bacterium]|jgi:electron transport complex protein RnfG|nr:FMN-binding protein [Desulfobacterales bacterium]
MGAENSEKSAGSSRLKQNYLVQAWLVLLLAVCFGSALAAVQMTLGPTIEANKLNETLEKVPELVYGQETAAQLQNTQQITIAPRQIEVKTPVKTTYYSVYDTAKEGKRSGWVVKAKGQGYADKIELLVGLDAGAEKITGLFILDQKETPGLGNKIIETKWRGQFIGKSTLQPLRVTKSGAKAPEEIDSVSGATISSDSVCSIVNITLGDLKDKLK